MLMTEPMVLPVDLLVVPVKDLPESVRKQVEAEDGDFALSRPNSRTPSRIIDSAAAELLKEFRSPVTIVEAVIRYSRERNVDPERTLEDAFPMLERLATSRLLLPSDSEESKHILPTLEPGSPFMGFEVIRCLQSLEDTELYQVKAEDGTLAALKLSRPNASTSVKHMFDREAAMLTRLNGGISPRLLRSDMTEDNRRYLLLQWCDGKDCAAAAALLRTTSSGDSRRRLLLLCCTILDAYALLHSRNVIHSDIHPRNVLVDEEGNVKLIDFGFARISGIENEFRRAQRAGVAYFFEPEYASAARKNAAVPASSALGEQFALGALLYSLITGNNYLDFSLAKDEMLRQIAEDTPLPFQQRGGRAWPEVEQVLARALSKQTSERYPSISDFANALRMLVPDEPVASEDAVAPAPYPLAEEVQRRLLARVDIHQALYSAGLSAAPKVSVTYGSAGIAYALYRIACARGDSQLLAGADLWATRASRDVDLTDAFYNKELDLTPEVVGRTSPFHTASGIYLVQVLIARAMGDLLTQQLAMERFLAASQAFPCDGLDVTLGHSGSLLGAAFLLDAFSGSKYLDATAIRAYGNTVLDDIWQKLNSFKSIRECKEIMYSGAAHGWAGILYATLQWCRASGEPIPPNLKERLDQLGRFAEHSGRAARWKWNTRKSASTQTGDYMAGWCNGSAGFVFLWTLAHQMLHANEYESLAVKAAFDAWESESMIGNLCCGYAGQAFAMLNLYKHTGELAWLHRAQSLTERAARAIKEMPSGGDFLDLVMRPESLYKGELGVAVLVAELDQPKFAVMPLFEAES